MADHAAIRKRKELWKSIIRTTRGTLLEELATTETKQLDAAAKYFQTDLADSKECAILLRILADIAFNKKRPGRKQGSKRWSNARFITLGFYAEQLMREEPGLSAVQIGLRLKEKYPAEFKNDSSVTLRQRLPQGRREYANALRALELKPPRAIKGIPVLGVNITSPGGVLGL